MGGRARHLFAQHIQDNRSFCSPSRVQRFDQALRDYVPLSFASFPKQRPQHFGRVLEQPCNRWSGKQWKCYLPDDRSGINFAILWYFWESPTSQRRPKSWNNYSGSHSTRTRSDANEEREMADLDRQIPELQSQRSAIASEFERDFEANKPRLAEYAAGAKWIQALKTDKRTWQAEITISEVKWLDLKATLQAFLLLTP